MNPSKLPKVSFIIPTLNASHTLGRCLSAIRAQTYPQSQVEIIVSDGGSTDDTVKIANKYNAMVIKNPEVLHEHGKSRASKIATGDLVFYTDADNILAHTNWLSLMVRPYMDNPKIMGFLPQTIPAQDSNPIDRYMGYLFTDPFTWFVYYPSANPKDYDYAYTPMKTTPSYKIYQFSIDNPPLFGLSQGVGTNKLFKRDSYGYADDLLAGIKLIEQGGLVAYIPDAGVYHYHVTDLNSFIRKYSWRTRNNLSQEVKGMGIVNRTKFFSLKKKFRMYLFLPYAFSILFPFIDALRLSARHHDFVMLWHVPMSFIMASIIVHETVKNALRLDSKLKNYG